MSIPARILGISLIGSNGENWGIFIPDGKLFEQESSDDLDTPITESPLNVRFVGKHTCGGSMRIVSIDQETTYSGPVVLNCVFCGYSQHLGDWQNIISRGQFLRYLDDLMLQKAAKAQQKSGQQRLLRQLADQNHEDIVASVRDFVHRRQVAQAESEHYRKIAGKV